MSKAKKIIIVVSISLILIGAIVGTVLYFKHKADEQEKLNIAIATVAEVNDENLEIDYNKDYTNKDVSVKLTTSSEYSIMYRIQELIDITEETEQQNKENVEYTKYEEPITISANSHILIKYMNNYGTYSKNEYKIEIYNIDKVIPTIVRSEPTVTTNTVKIDISAIDNIEIAKIEVSIDNEDYKEVLENTYTFENLKEGTQYTIKIRVTDKAGNIKEDEVNTTTKVTLKQETTSKNTSSNSTKKPSSSTSTNNTTNSTTNTTTSGELSKAEKEAQARVVARQIASQCATGTDLDRVTKASRLVYGYYARGVHKETGTDYRTAYGVFIKGEASCAGCCRALGMVLSEMGFSYKHINENQWTHQWLELTMDGQHGWADANIGMAGYDTYPFR